MFEDFMKPKNLSTDKELIVNKDSKNSWWNQIVKFYKMADKMIFKI